MRCISCILIVIRLLYKIVCSRQIELRTPFLPNLLGLIVTIFGGGHTRSFYGSKTFEIHEMIDIHKKVVKGELLITRFTVIDIHQTT